jgi:uncharacterized protein YkwD
MSHAPSTWFRFLRKPLAAGLLALTAISIGSIVNPETRPAFALTNCSVTNLTVDAEEQAFLVLINNYRAQNGRGALTMSANLNRMASWHAKDMADKSYFSHTDSFGRSPGTRGSQCDTAGGIGENIAAGTAWDTAQEAFTAWRNSPGHNSNMLNGSYPQIGIARYFNAAAPYDWYWVTDFSLYNDGTNIGGGGATPPPPPPNPPAPPPPPPPAPPPPGPQTITTAYRNCAVSVARPTGDMNGYETNGIGACADGGGVATDSNSGTTAGTSCALAGKDRNIFRNYGFTLPADAVVQGIQLRLDAWADSSTGVSRLCIELFVGASGVGTAPRYTAELSSSETTLTLGSASDTWGRSWTAADINSLVVRVTNVSDNTSRDFFLDWAAVRVTYVDP